MPKIASWTDRENSNSIGPSTGQKSNKVFQNGAIYTLVALGNNSIDRVLSTQRFALDKYGP